MQKEHEENEEETHPRTLSHAHTRTHWEKNTGWSNDGAPPLSESEAMVSPHNTGQQRTRSGHNTTQTHQARVSWAFFFPSLSLGGEGGGLSEDQTYRRPPVTHHHYISAQLAPHSSRFTLSRGGRRGGGRGASLFGWCVELDNTPEGRDSTTSTSTTTQQKSVWVSVDVECGDL